MPLDPCTGIDRKEINQSTEAPKPECQEVDRKEINEKSQNGHPSDLPPTYI